MGGETLTDLSFTGERKGWVAFRKSIRKVVDEENMDLVITTGTTMTKFFIQMDAENEAPEGDKWDVLSQDLEIFDEDDILRDSNMRGDQRAGNMLKIFLSRLAHEGCELIRDRKAKTDFWNVGL